MIRSNTLGISLMVTWCIATASLTFLTSLPVTYQRLKAAMFDGKYSRFLQTVSYIPDAQLYTALERIVLTANGNLQRILSAYYDMPIEVKVLQSDLREGRTFNREVLLQVMDSDKKRVTREEDRLLCHIKGQITVHDETVFAAVQAGTVGIGQLFNQMHIQPTYRLYGAGRIPLSISAPSSHQRQKLTVEELAKLDHSLIVESDSQWYALWRDYELSSDILTCRFTETFQPQFLQIAVENLQTK